MSRRIVAVCTSMILLLNLIVITVDDVPPAGAAVITVDDDWPTDYFELCRGYWIHATQECEWDVPL